MYPSPFLVKNTQRYLLTRNKIEMNESKTIYDAFFGYYIGKKVSLTDDGYYHCVDYINGRFYIGILRHVTYSERGIVLHLDNNEITVSSTTKISVIE